jgi:hypothetical protein
MKQQRVLCYRPLAVSRTPTPVDFPQESAGQEKTIRAAAAAIKATLVAR